DRNVTGVQTCALPIYRRPHRHPPLATEPARRQLLDRGDARPGHCSPRRPGSPGQGARGVAARPSDRPAGGPAAMTVLPSRLDTSSAEYADARKVMLERLEEIGTEHAQALGRGALRGVR